MICKKLSRFYGNCQNVKTLIDFARNICIFDINRVPLVLQPPVFLAGCVTADDGLQPGDDLSHAVITHLFKLTQGTGLEEDLMTGGQGEINQRLANELRNKC